MISLHLKNRTVRIDGASEKLLKRLDVLTSYLVEGHRFSPKFRKRRWDGKEHLLRYHARRDPPGYYFPIGLVFDVIAALEGSREEYRLVDLRQHLNPKEKFSWSLKVTMRPYQLEAVEAMTTGHMPGVGILKMPPRSGKTITTARMIHDLQATTLVIVPSKWLLHQTAKTMELALQIPVGKIGDGMWSYGLVTVATIETLHAHRGGIREREVEGRLIKEKIPQDPIYTALLSKFDLVVMDEVHHLRGKEWHKVFDDFESFYRIGLSATAFPDHEREQSKGGIWLKACCGQIRFDVSPSRLIQEGFLMRPVIEMHRIQAPNMEDRPWDPELLNDGIYANDYRNERIADIANRMVRQQNLKTLIVTNRKEQARRLARLLEARGLLQECVFGDTPTETRGRLVDKLVRGFLDVLIGTVFGEGVDIPEVECVINAEGGRDIKATFQRMRNLTVAQGKTTAVFVDFLDMINPHLALHSLDRLRVYRSEPAFVIRTI